jgi:hypothetical protein
MTTGSESHAAAASSGVGLGVEAGTGLAVLVGTGESVAVALCVGLAVGALFPEPSSPQPASAAQMNRASGKIAYLIRIVSFRAFSARLYRATPISGVTLARLHCTKQ